MDIRIRRLVSSVLMLILITTLLFPACSQTPSQPVASEPSPATSPTNINIPGQTPLTTPATPPPAPAPSTPVQATLALSESPLLDKPVELTATFTVSKQKIEIKNLDVELVLPDGFQLVEGSLADNINVLPDSPTQFQAMIKAVKTGIWEIQVKASYPFPVFVSGKGHALGVLYANISEDSAEVSDIPLGPKIGHGGPAKPPPGWTPPPGYENVTPIPTSPPPVPEPPGQDIPPDKLPPLP